jgi:hypothetical protein
MGRDGVDGIATVYGLNSPAIGFWYGRISRTRPDLSWSPPSLPFIRYRLIPGGKAAGTERYPPTPSSANVKERTGLYCYSPCAVMAGSSSSSSSSSSIGATTLVGVWLAL